MSQPPPSRVPEEILRESGVAIREYYTRLTSGLYYLWDQLKNVTESRVKLIENALPGISGVVPTRDSATELTFSSGYISTGGKVYEVSELTKTLGTAWAEGDAVGGEFSGATIGNTDDYYAIAISKDSAPSTVDIGFDDNEDGTNAPTGWTVLKEVFRGMTNGSGEIDDFTAEETAGGGLWVRFPLTSRQFQDNNPGITIVTKTTTAPPSVLAQLTWQVIDRSAQTGTSFRVYDEGQPNRTPSDSDNDMQIRTQVDADEVTVHVNLDNAIDSSRQIRYRLSNSTSDHFVRAWLKSYVLERR